MEDRNRGARAAACGVIALGVGMLAVTLAFGALGWGACTPSAIVGADGARACSVLMANNEIGGVYEGLGFAAMGLLFATLGAVLGAKRSDNVVGWLFAAAGLLFLTNAMVNVVTVHAAEAPGTVPAAGAFAVSSEVIGGPIVFAPFVFFSLLFPDGRLLSPRWRIAVWAAALAVVGQSLSLALHPGPLRLAPLTANPLGVGWLGGTVRGTVDIVSFVLLLAGLVAGVTSLVVRFRRSRGVQRQQMKWFTTATAFAGATLVLGPLFWAVPALEPLWGPLFLVSTASVPVAATVAILRYRLYDIDVLINRALVYGALTGLLGATYLALVVGLQAITAGRTGTSDVAVAVSTLAVAALFRPLRARVQRFIDRRFYRRRYDALRTLDAFSAALRQETDVATVRSGLLEVVHDTIQPARAALWLRSDRRA